MKLFNTPSFPSQYMSNVGSNALIYAFTGEVPANVESIPFDYNDHVALTDAAASVHVASCSQISGNLLKFANTYTAKRPVGYKLDKSVGKYLLAPSAFRFDPTHPKFDVLDLAYGHVNMMNLEGPISNIGNTQDHYFEYDFGREVTLDRIHCKHYTNASYSISDFELQRLVGETWESCETGTFAYNSLESGKAFYDLTQSYTATKFRIIPKTNTNLYQGGFTFYANNEPAENVVSAPYTWFLIRSTEERTLSDDVAIVIGNAGGPNSNQEMALTHYNSEPATEVKLLNFKLKSLVMNEVV